MSEPTPPNDPKKMDRRGFLKLALSGTIGGGLLMFGLPIAERNRGLLGFNPNESDIPSEVPPSLRGLEIPKSNENLREAEDILKTAFSINEIWRKENPRLSLLKYNRPKNYLDISSVARSIKEDLDHESLSFGLLLDVFGKNDLPYANYKEGSGGGIDGVANMIDIDPGTGLVANLRSDFQKRYGIDVWSKCHTSTITKEQQVDLEASVKMWFDNATNYIQDSCDKLGKKISSSLLLAYFLSNDDGDILKGIWDTAVWFKIAVRNDLPSLKFDPNRDKADFVNKFFIDEFSQTVSVNWVIDNVPKTDKDLNTVEKFDHPEWKDYMPVNRAGDFYHFWNIIGLCSVMSPEVAKRLVDTYLQLSIVDPISGKVYPSEYGRVKTMSDATTVSRAPEIASLLEKYEK